MITAMPLPFAADALSPHVSAETFAHHHGKHFAAYVRTANELLDGTPDADHDLETIIQNAATAGTAGLFNAAGQVWNHGFFWASLSPPSANRPAGTLGAAIVRDFGSFEAMASAFVAAGTGQFGSGWAWLVRSAQGRLAITTTPDAMPAWLAAQGTPLLVCDVWEHAYYIDWRSDRSGFLTAFINRLANWEQAEQLHAAPGAGHWRYPS